MGALVWTARGIIAAAWIGALLYFTFVVPVTGAGGVIFGWAITMVAIILFTLVRGWGE